VPQAKEFIHKYDPDIIWYDGDWSTLLEKIHTYDIAAYLYNKAERPGVDRMWTGTKSEFWITMDEYGDVTLKPSEAR